MTTPVYQANDKYRATLRSTWIASPADSTILVTAIPTNTPTIITVGWGTIYETVFSVTATSGDNSSNYALTGVTRIKGYNGNLPESSSVNCLNNEEYFNQYGTLIAAVQNDANSAIAATSGLPPTVVGTTGVQTLTNKRYTRRVNSVTGSTGTITPNKGNEDMLSIAALAVTGAFQVPGGTAVVGDSYIVEMKDNGTARALTWATGAGGYVAGGTDLPSTTVTGKYLHVGFMYVTANSLNKWMCLAAQQES